MKKILVYLLCCIIINGTMAQDEIRRYPRLTSTDQARPGQFPYTVSIQFYEMHNCGGALISDRHVLTAAHCVHNETEEDYLPNELSVVVGSTNLTNPNVGTVMDVEYIGYHPAFTFNNVFPQTATNDIAVLRLVGSIPDQNTIKPVALPSSMYEEYDGASHMVVTGFGADSNEGSPSPYMRMMIVLQVDSQSCQRVYDRVLDASHLCVLSVEGFDACPGDSGGPLVLRRKGSIVGVLSEGPSAGCGTGIPNIVTKVSHYLDFIHDEMEKL
ncbi:hypothetical protein QAD02_009948 [Eretmocerus hayati]|uniref:Uncharacterized protein n=1 Tax=Eretmocerus hayati TaxID=131215 RepID=A0ACC2NAX3_9HYME|nr:hypothetical protein QAD02_009948 [Eretmocerus hayati]